MKLNAPKKNTWLIAVILGVVDIVASYVTIPYISAYSGYLVMAGFGILALATFLKGL